jgi:tetratricopeptide (TPR) repeat protein
LKRFVITALFALGCAVAALAVTTPSAQAGLFGGKSSATPTPSPVPSALPTASPEPPSVAIPRLTAKLKANPNDQQAMTELAAQFLQINRPDMTMQLTQRLLHAGDKSAQIYYFDGFAQEALGNVPAATYDLEQASNLDPTNMGVLAQLSDVYLKQHRCTDAERVAKRAVTFNKTEPAALETLGSVYASCDAHYDEARTQFEAAAKLNPKDAAPIFQIASTYQQQNNIPMALQTIDRALNIDPRNLQALLFKAQLYAAQHDDAKTSQAFDDAIVAATTDDQKAGIMVKKAAYFIEEKKNPQGETILQQTITQYPKVAAGFVAYGAFYASTHQIDKAIAQWKAALAIDPDNSQALMGLGEVTAQSGHATDAIGYFKHYTQVQPDDPQGYALLGQAYSQTHNYGGARDACGKSFEIQRSPETLVCVAGADYELRNYKEAAQIFDVIDRAAKGFLDANPQMLYIAAKSYQASNQCSKAAAAYKRLLPMIRAGTKDYTNVKKSASDPCRPSSSAHSG